MAVITPIGTAISAVARASMMVPWIACTAPPPTTRLVMPRWELVHQRLSSSIWPPLLATLHRIQARGTIAIANAVHITMRASWLRRARAPDLWLRLESGLHCFVELRFESDATSVVVIRRRLSYARSQRARSR